MGIPIEQLEPGAVIKTPEVFRLLGWESPNAVYAGGGSPDKDAGCPLFLLDNKGVVSKNMWPAGPKGYPAPMPEFELSQPDEKFQKAVEGMVKGGLKYGMLGSSYPSGTDPEFFVVDGAGEVMPARSFLRDKAHSPSMYFDGLQAEITTSGEQCLEVLSKRIALGLQNAQNVAKRINPDARIVAKNHFKFSPERMASFSPEDIRFRCSSSLNIYDDLGEVPEAREYPWRFAGGHIHIGCLARYAPVIKAMVRALDGIVGVAGVSLARHWDTAERRRMYGRAGEFRLPKHGLEYRVLSNFWLCSPLIYHLVFEMVRYAYRIGEAGAFGILYKGTEEEIRNCINHCDVQLADKLIEDNAPLYSSIFQAVWGSDKTRSVKKAMETLRNGLEVAVQQPDAVVENWRLDSAGGYPARWGRTFA
jgi:hypothetical protein